MGRKWAQVENPPFSKNGRQKKKDGGAHRFFEEKKSPIFLISLSRSEVMAVSWKTVIYFQSLPGGAILLRWLNHRFAAVVMGGASQLGVHTASAQNVQDQSFKQKGLGAHGFGTERARLVVQVKKRACYLWGFRFFFLKIPPIFKLEVGFFSAKKKFFADFPKYGKFFPSKLYF